MNKIIHINNFIKYLLGWLRNNFIYISIIFSATLFISIRFLAPPREPIIPLTTPILFRVDSIHVKASDILAHNSAIRTFLHENMAMDVSSMTAQENVKMQTRSFYVIILVALLSFMLGNSKSQHPKNFIEKILLFIVILIFLIEVHNDDLNKRTNISFDVKGVAVQKLLNTNINNTIWYNVSPDTLNSELYKIHEVKNRWLRKLQAACDPNAEQIVFYLVPFIAVYLRILSRRKNRNLKT